MHGIVIVVGDSIVDSYVVGKSTRLSPEAPVPVVDITSKTMCPGGAANVACGIQAMGVPTLLVTPVGNNYESSKIPEMVSHYGVTALAPLVYGWQNPVKKRILSNGQYTIRLDEESDKLSDKVVGFSSYETLAVSKATDAAVSGVGQLKAVVVSDYAKGAVSTNLLQRLVFCKSYDSNILVIGDVKNHNLLSYLDLVTPNFKEACAFAVRSESEFSIHDDKSCEMLCSDILLKHKGLSGVVVTRGEFGCSWRLTDDLAERLKTSFKSGSFKAYPVCSSDPTGAGDTFTACLTASLAQGTSFYTAISNANAAAALAVSSTGTQVVSQMALLNFNESIRSKQSKPKIMTQPELLSELNKYRSPNNKIVFTNGCFDILHAGHVDLLEKAKQQGDYLVVAVDSDSSVSHLKGSTRPFVNQEARAKLLAALACVDFVVIFNQGELENLISQVNPDVLVKGGEYSPEQVPGYSFVTSKGGSFVSVPMTENQSTTSIATLVGNRLNTRS